MRHVTQVVNAQCIWCLGFFVVSLRRCKPIGWYVKLALLLALHPVIIKRRGCSHLLCSGFAFVILVETVAVLLNCPLLSFWSDIDGRCKTLCLFVGSSAPLHRLSPLVVLFVAIWPWLGPLHRLRPSPSQWWYVSRS